MSAVHRNVLITPNVDAKGDGATGSRKRTRDEVDVEVEVDRTPFTIKVRYEGSTWKPSILITGTAACV
jgi:hypothetical protein